MGTNNPNHTTARIATKIPHLRQVGDRKVQDDAEDAIVSKIIDDNTFEIEGLTTPLPKRNRGHGHQKQTGDCPTG